MIYDSESVITCLNNDGEADSAVVYVTRDKRLYTGSDPLRRGNLPLRFRYRWISSIQERPAGFVVRD